MVRIVDKQGNFHTTWYSAVVAYRRDPKLEFYIEKLEGMSGLSLTNVTDEVRRRSQTKNYA